MNVARLFFLLVVGLGCCLSWGQPVAASSSPHVLQQGRPVEAAVPPVDVPQSFLRRKLPGNDYSFDGMGSPEMMGGLLLVIVVVIFLCLCCGRGGGSLCDILACVCLYEMCCDDGQIGGFNLL